MTNHANAQEHVPEAEHNNHVLKESIHATYHGIPYKMLPRTIICYMVMETAAKLSTHERWLLKLLQTMGNSPPCEA